MVMNRKVIFRRSFLAFFALIAVYFALRVTSFDRFRIPTHSMEPTLIPGDNILVCKWLMGARIYTDFNFSPEGAELKSRRMKGTRSIRRNDIVVFNRANRHGGISFVINDVYCKRCVALPGDTISIVNGYYKNNHYKGQLGSYVEQKTLSETPDSMLRQNHTLRAMPKERHFNWTIRHFGPMYVPRKGDVVRMSPETATLYKMIIEWETGANLSVDWDQGKVFSNGKTMETHEFAHNYYFMAGDCVSNSDDSRYKGLVPEEYVVGIVTHILYSRHPESGKIRWDRIWRKVR